MKAKHRERVAQIRADGDLTHEAKERRIKEEGEKYHAARRAEEERVTAALRDEIEGAYRKAYGPGPSLEAADELRLARLREEVRDELDTKRLDPIRGYEEAVRAGDKERAEVIGKIGPRYLEGFRRTRLAELVEENLPESERRARRRLAELESARGRTSRWGWRCRGGLGPEVRRDGSGERAGRGGAHRGPRRGTARLEGTPGGRRLPPSHRHARDDAGGEQALVSHPAGGEVGPVGRWECDNRKARAGVSVPPFSAPTPVYGGEGTR